MRFLVLTLGLLSFSTPAPAVPISFTGAELANLSSASFPTGGQRIVGDSLRWDPTILRAVLYRLPLDGFVIDPSNIGISAITTRLRTDQNGLDQDISFGIYDGQNLFNIFFVDSNSSQSVRAQNRIDSLDASERFFVPGSFVESGPLISSPIGSVVQLDTTIQATATGTTLIGEFNQSGATTSTFSPVLNLSGTLSLVILGSNTNENHLLRSLTFTSGVSLPTAVAEPGALGGLALGLATLGFGVFRRRFR